MKLYIFLLQTSFESLSLALPSCGGRTLVRAGHLSRRFCVIILILILISGRSSIEESVCCVWKIATLRIIGSDGKMYNFQQEIVKETALNSYSSLHDFPISRMDIRRLFG
jgi:hypothetical protein